MLLKNYAFHWKKADVTKFFNTDIIQPALGITWQAHQCTARARFCGDLSQFRPNFRLATVDSGDLKCPTLKPSGAQASGSYFELWLSKRLLYDLSCLQWHTFCVQLHQYSLIALKSSPYFASIWARKEKFSFLHDCVVEFCGQSSSFHDGVGMVVMHSSTLGHSTCSLVRFDCFNTNLKAWRRSKGSGDELELKLTMFWSYHA